MTRTIQLIIGVALLINIASAATLTVSTASSASATNSAFNSTPVTVLNVGTNTTDQAKWANIPASQVKYGGSLDGTKIYAYGYTTTVSGTTTTIASVVSRTLNSTIVGWGNDTTLASVVSDTSATTTFTATSGPVAQAVPGYLVLAWSDSDGATTAANQVYAVAWAGGASSATKVALTAIAKPTDTNGAVTGTSTAATTTAYSYSVQSILSEDGIVYVTFIQKSTTDVGTKDAAGAFTTGTVATVDAAIWVQGFYAANGTLYYSAPKSIATLGSTATNTAAVCGLSNYTNSTNINCLYTVGTGAVTASNTPSISYTSFVRATGTAGSAATVATSSTTGTGATLLTQEFAPSGILSGGALASGALYSTKNTTGATPTYTYGLNQWNTTGTAGAVASGVSATSPTGNIIAAGGPYPNGYFIAGAYPTGSASSYTYFIAPFLSNGTAASAQATLASVDNARANFFTDVNGSLWFGYSTYETASGSSYTAAGTAIGVNNVIQGSVGKVYKTTYSSSGSFGSVLSTFFAFMALVIATLFAF